MKAIRVKGRAVGKVADDGDDNDDNTSFVSLCAYYVYFYKACLQLNIRSIHDKLYFLLCSDWN